ncbi:expressed unknown protein [Seminavis robusta]|uniref:Uncharacterized protein n=1 Tax=Seminavis robusta TaxID=568900 RepID=A0A9N8EHF5_9STRA|nr:expressed unknown protein [Seminavis robusta]|eukprot:Sro1173_g248960.1 n/a (903) ;mRNA; f:13524-16232
MDKLLDYSKHRACTSCTSTSTGNFLDESQSSRHSITSTTRCSSATRRSIEEALSTTERLLSLPWQCAEDNDRSTSTKRKHELDASTSSSKSLSCSDRLRFNLSLKQRQIRGEQLHKESTRKVRHVHQQQRKSTNTTSTTSTTSTSKNHPVKIQFELKKQKPRSTNSSTITEDSTVWMEDPEDRFMDVSSSAHRLHKSLLAQLHVAGRQTKNNFLQDMSTSTSSSHSICKDHTRRKEPLSTSNNNIMSSLEDSFGSLDLDFGADLEVELDDHQDISDVWDTSNHEHHRGLDHDDHTMQEDTMHSTYCIHEGEEPEEEEDEPQDEPNQGESVSEDTIQPKPKETNETLQAPPPSLLPVVTDRLNQSLPQLPTTWTPRHKSIADIAGSWNQRNQPDLLSSASRSSTSSRPPARNQSLSPVPSKSKKNQLHYLLRQQANTSSTTAGRQQQTPRSPNMSFASKSKLNKLNASMSNLLNESNSSLLAESLQRPSNHGSRKTSRASFASIHSTNSQTTSTRRNPNTTTTGNLFLDSRLRQRMRSNAHKKDDRMGSGSYQNAQWSSSSSSSTTAASTRINNTEGKASVFTSNLAMLASLTRANQNRDSTVIPPAQQQNNTPAHNDRIHQSLMMQSKLNTTTMTASPQTTNNSNTNEHPPPQWNAQWRSVGPQQQQQQRTKRANNNPFLAIINSPVGTHNQTTTRTATTLLSMMDETETPMLFNKRTKVVASDGKVAAISRSSSMASLSMSGGMDHLMMEGDDDDELATTKLVATPRDRQSEEQLSTTSSHHRRHRHNHKLDHHSQKPQRQRSGLLQEQRTNLSGSQHHLKRTTMDRRLGSSASAINLDQMAAMISRSTSAAKLRGMKRNEGSSSRANLMSDAIFYDPSHFVTGSRIRRYQSSGTLAFMLV